MKPYLFQQERGHFKVAVFALSLQAARKHIKSQAASCAGYRSLRYICHDHPRDPAGWLGANALPREEAS